jgi:plasmid stabilization system protein ParE
MKIEILREAEAELNEAITSYEEIEPGLGIRLKEEARAAIRWIGKNPTIPRLRSKGYRRVNLKVFRYYIPYFIWGDSIWILAMAHGSRHPEYWIERKPDSPPLPSEI